MITFQTLYSLFARPTPALPEAAFWKWFEKNEAMLFDFERDPQRTLGRLSAELQKVHPGLTFEFGPRVGNRRDFVISADGKRSAFSEVERLHAAAPLLPQWSVLKFRPRREPFDLEYRGLSVKVNTVFVALTPNRDKLDVTMIIPGYNAKDKDTFVGVAFLLLDNVLGEYDVETRIGKIDVQDTDYVPETAWPLAELAKQFDARFGRRR
jgi:hypothetical protein